MDESLSILVIGEGRIAKAVFYYLKKSQWVKEVKFFSQVFSKNSLHKFSLFISALPSKIASQGLELALTYGKDLIDISDLDPPFYLKKKKEIKKAKITVIPGCGFCPGLVNFILGREIFLNPKIDSASIRVGSLSPQSFFFPFLWCFEDLIQEHRLPSWQIISNKKIKLGPFSGYMRENFFGIEAESYYSVSGFENILQRKNFRNFCFRVVRPYGFMFFFKFLENYGFFNKENLNSACNFLEKRVEENYTFALLEFKEKAKETIRWRIRSFSKKEEKLNSMQKITALVGVGISQIIFIRNFQPQRLIFMEELGRDAFIFKGLVNVLRKNGIVLRREVS